MTYTESYNMSQIIHLYLFVHVIFQNSCKKGPKCILNLEVHTKNSKNEKKRKHISVEFVCFYIPCAVFFLHFQTQNS